MLVLFISYQSGNMHTIDANSIAIDDTVIKKYETKSVNITLG